MLPKVLVCPTGDMLDGGALFNGIQQTLVTVPEAIENLTLALCKRQKWKEQVKGSKCRKCGDLILKTVTLVRFF